ncbi:MAG: manganese-dependent inorganic pyrophosphatase [Candidatus Moranbacteria bacterium]|nr:manganese-dependent inorganic pyrophosphatase [Candidatus Moranbacteria bacterium]
MIKVFGHKAPDTDSVGSAILWSWYLNTHTSSDAAPYVLGELNKETIFVLDRWNIPEPERLDAVESSDEVVIVDTNNPDELFGNISDVNVVRIIDHHRLAGGLSTPGPIDMIIRPVACTSTVIHDLVSEHIDTMPNHLLGLMLSCILSDTLAFRSPTTTPHDKDIAEKLAKRLGVDIQAFANEMFAAKSDLSDFSDSRIVRLDGKMTEVGGKRILVSVVETTTPEQIIERKEGIVEAIRKIVAEDGIDEVLFFIIDLFHEEATAFTYNPFTAGMISESFGVTVESDTEVLPGVLSRKKQIVPVLRLPEAS